MLIGGRDVSDLRPAERGLAMVFQNYAVFPHMTVYDNVAFGLSMQKKPADHIDRKVREKLEPLARRVYAIVNYDNFSIVPELLDRYSAMVRGLMDDFYSGVTRYTTSGFLRVLLGEALEKRAVSPHIFENAEEARKDLGLMQQSGG